MKINIFLHLAEKNCVQFDAVKILSKLAVYMCASLCVCVSVSAIGKTETNLVSLPLPFCKLSKTKIPQTVEVKSNMERERERGV